MPRAKKTQPIIKGHGAGIPPRISPNEHWDEGNLHVLRMEINMLRKMGTPEDKNKYAVTGANLGRLLVMLLVAKVNDVEHDCTQDDLNRIATIVSSLCEEEIADYHACVKLYNELFTCQQFAMSECNKAGGFFYLLSERMIEFWSLDKELQNIKNGTRTTELSRYERQRKAALFLPADAATVIDADGLPVISPLKIQTAITENARGIIADLSKTAMDSLNFVIMYNDYITLLRKHYKIFELLGLQIDLRPLLNHVHCFNANRDAVLADKNLIYRDLFLLLFNSRAEITSGKPPKNAIDAALKLMKKSGEGHFGILQRFAEAYANNKKGSNNENK